MAIFYDAPVDPDALTAFVREVPVGAGRRLLAEAGTDQSDDNTVDWQTITKKNRTAKFRAFDGAIAKSNRNSGSDRRVRLLPLGSSLDVGEYERLQLEFARLGGTNTARLAQAIYDDGEQLTNEVLNRLELGLGDILTDGILTINENGYQGEADFGVPSNQKVTAGTVWSNSAAKPLTDLIAWHDVWLANGNAPAEAIRTSQAVIRFLSRNAEIIAAAYGTAAGRTSVTRLDLNTVLTNEGLPPLVDPFDEKLEVDGVDTRVIPEDRLLFTPAALSDIVNVTYGVSATALELVGSNESELDFEEAPGIVGIVAKDGPPFRQTTFVDAVAMPILGDANRLLIADVL